MKLLYCIVLSYFLLYYSILYYIILYFIILYNISYFIISYGKFGGDQIDGNFEGFPLIIVHCEGVGNIMTPCSMGTPNSHQFDTPKGNDGCVLKFGIHSGNLT